MADFQGLSEIESNQDLEILRNNIVDELIYTRKLGIQFLEIIDKNEPVCMKKDVVLLLFYEVLKNLDAIIELYKSSCISACMPLIRTAFECILELLYVIQSDENIAYCYKYFDYINHKKLANKLEGNADKEAIIEMCDKNLSSSKYEKIKKKYADVKRKYGKYPNWYSLFNGPSNLKKLSEKVKCKDIYELLYPFSSLYAHGYNAMDNLYLSKKDKKCYLKTFRNSRDLISNTQVILRIYSIIYASICENYIKNKYPDIVINSLVHIESYIKKISTIDIIQ